MHGEELGMALTAAEKKTLREKHPFCYVCQPLGLAHAGFDGYADSQIQYDHGFAQGLVGGAQADLLANQRPIHAAAGQPGPSHRDYETSMLRNCHAGKSNEYTGPEWADRVSIDRRSMRVRFADDLIKRSPRAKSSVVWDEATATASFMGSTYPVMVQSVGSDHTRWRSFSTLVPPSLLWTDVEVQPRPANQKRLADFAWHLKEHPLLSPILARWSPEQGKILVFDGNHRLSAYVLARGDVPIPVTIFEGPDPLAFFEVAVEAHDNLTQLKYQYSDKALKFSALSAHELHQATEKWGPDASEEKAWQGLTSSDARLRIVGSMTLHLEATGHWRSRWLARGLTDPSWNRFIETYVRLTPETKPFDDPGYLRGAERENMVTLCRIFDEELFEQLGDPKFPGAKSSLKTKWWKRAHARFASVLSYVAMDSMGLDNQPRQPAYAPEWNDYVKKAVREMAINWRQSPAWNEPTVSNNEAEIDEQLDARHFTEKYLRSSGKK
jgi:hypothetical protein